MFARQPTWGTLFTVPATMTGDDLLCLPDDGAKNELYEGMLVREEMTSIGHGMICHHLSVMLGVYAMNTGFLNTIVQNALFDLTPPGSRKTVLAPDVAILRQAVPQTFSVTTDVPLIAIEVVSPSQTLAELAIKAQFYRGAGVDEVWLIEPGTRIIEIWNASGTTTLTAADSLTSALPPGFAVTVSDLVG